MRGLVSEGGWGGGLIHMSGYEMSPRQQKLCGRVGGKKERWMATIRGCGVKMDPMTC